MWTTSLLPTYPQPNKFLIWNGEGYLERFAEQKPASSVLVVERRSVEAEKSIPLLTQRKMELFANHRPKRRRRDATEDYLESGAAA